MPILLKVWEEKKEKKTRLTLPLFLGEKHALTATTAGLTTLTTPAELQKKTNKKDNEIPLSYSEPVLRI